MGQSGGKPWWRQTAAATAANTASEPLTGGPGVGVDLDLDARGVDGPGDAERADGEVVHLAVLVDGQPLRGDPADGHVGRADRIGAQHDLVERIAARHPDPHDRPRRRPSRSTVAGADSPVGALDPDRLAVTEAGGRRDGGQQHRGLGPARGPRRRSTSADRPASTSSTSRPGATGADALGDARRAHDPDDPGAVGPDAGRDRGTLGAEPHGVLAGEQHPHRPTVAGRPAPGPPRRPGESTLPPNAPPLASGRHRLAARLAPRGVGLEVGRLDPRRAQGHGPVARRAARAAARVSAVVRRPCTLPAASRAAARVSPTAQPPAPSGTATSASAGAVSAANPARPSADVGPDVLRRRGPRWWPVAPAASRSAVDAIAGPDDLRSARPARARPVDRRRRRPRRSCASRCSGRGGPAAPARPRPCRRRPRPWSAAPRSA